MSNKAVRGKRKISNLYSKNVEAQASSKHRTHKLREFLQGIKDYNGDDCINDIGFIHHSNPTKTVHKMLCFQYAFKLHFIQNVMIILLKYS